MAKERLILSFVAILAGLIVASSIFYFYQQKTQSVSKNDSPTPSAPVQNSQTTLTIESPENESVTDKKTIEVVGRASPNSLIVISADTKDYIFITNDDGSFKTDIALSSDENIIAISAYPQNGTSETKEIIVTYSTEEF